MTEPEVTFTALPHADGSAAYNHQGYSILATVNGPLEVQRRDEIPDEAHLEVTVREATGVGGPRERQLEARLHATIRPLLLATAHPRTLIQLTLQVLRAPEHAATAAPAAQHAPLLPPLPHLVNAAVLALLDGNVAMAGVGVATALATTQQRVVDEPAKLASALSGEDVALHAFAFTGEGRLLLAESEGECALDEWERAAARARELCCGSDEGEEGGLLAWLRKRVALELEAKTRWKS